MGNNIRYHRAVALLVVLLAVTMADAQPVLDKIRADRYYAATNYCVYACPDSGYRQTPAPAGKHPFYISHYGRHGSRYLSSKKAYVNPYRILTKAFKEQRLTPLGEQVRQQLADIIRDSHERWGDLSELGRTQHRDIARRMMRNYPEVFSGKAHIQARSTTVNRCALSMASALQQLLSMNPQLDIDMDASHADMWYMNFQDKLLRDSMMTRRASCALNAFSLPRTNTRRLIEMLFADTTSVGKQDDMMLMYYLMKAALAQQNTRMSGKVTLLDLFTTEDIYHYWQRENAWWYICYGPSLLNGGNEPYTQRNLLRRLIADADSCLTLERPGAQLRYGHDTIVLPLCCLLGLNGYDFQTDNLEEVESHGWWASDIIPMGANLQFVFYRASPQDDDVVFKVLLNEKEARLPLPTDIAPYYHWRDFRSFYLKKLDAYSAKLSR